MEPESTLIRSAIPQHFNEWLVSSLPCGHLEGFGACHGWRNPCSAVILSHATSQSATHFARASVRPFLRVSEPSRNTGAAAIRRARWAATYLALLCVVGACSPAPKTTGSLDLGALTKPPPPPEPIAPTALMNPGDEVDDNIWVSRPRNRLQPGQSERPAVAASATRAPAGSPASAGGAPATSTRAAAPTQKPRADGASTGASARSGDASTADGIEVSLDGSVTGGLPGVEPEKAPGPRLLTRDSVNAAASSSSAAAPAGRTGKSEPEPPKGESASAPERSVNESGKPVWSVALATFSGDDHRAVAEAACRQFVQQFPQLQGAFVRTTGSGSVVMWGRFDGPRDPQAKPSIDQVKKLVLGDARPFQRAMLARLEQSSDEEIGPYDLRQVRRQNPNVRVIYTLQIAAWSDLGSGTMRFQQISKDAEDYCRKLRADGVDAWYFHDADQLTSIVTVGAFGGNAYDPQSTLYAPEVEAYRKRFPVSLLNGAELLIKADPSRPDATVPQPSRLVEVPR